MTGPLMAGPLMARLLMMRAASLRPRSSRDRLAGDDFLTWLPGRHDCRAHLAASSIARLPVSSQAHQKHRPELWQQSARAAASSGASQASPGTTKLSRDISLSLRRVVRRVPDSSFPVVSSAGVTVVTTPDEIDITNAGRLREALLAAAAGGQPVVVDMTGTEFCDSTGLNVLVRALRQAEQAGAGLLLVRRASALHRILAVSGVGELFRTYGSLADAVDAARAGRPAAPS